MVDSICIKSVQITPNTVNVGGKVKIAVEIPCIYPKNLYIMSMLSNNIKITALPDTTNKKIRMDYKHGKSLEELSKSYFLSIHSIKKIIRMDAGINMALPRLEHLQITYGVNKS